MHQLQQKHTSEVEFVSRMLGLLHTARMTWPDPACSAHLSPSVQLETIVRHNDELVAEHVQLVSEVPQISFPLNSIAAAVVVAAAAAVAVAVAACANDARRRPKVQPPLTFP